MYNILAEHDWNSLQYLVARAASEKMPCFHRPRLVRHEARLVLCAVRPNPSSHLVTRCPSVHTALPSSTSQFTDNPAWWLEKVYHFLFFPPSGIASVKSVPAPRVTRQKPNCIVFCVSVCYFLWRKTFINNVAFEKPQHIMDVNFKGSAVHI